MSKEEKKLHKRANTNSRAVNANGQFYSLTPLGAAFFSLLEEKDQKIVDR